MEIDLGPFIAAIVEEAGGEVRIPYESVIGGKGDKALAFDIVDDGATIAISLVDAKDIPDD